MARTEGAKDKKKRRIFSNGIVKGVTNFLDNRKNKKDFLERLSRAEDHYVHTGSELGSDEHYHKMYKEGKRKGYIK